MATQQSKQREFLESLEPVRPFEVKVEPALVDGEPPEIWVEMMYGDSHLYPGQDDSVLQIAEMIAEDLQPDGITHMGDLLDVYRPSAHRSDPHQRHSLQDEIDLGRAHLSRMAQLVPDTRRVLLEGNHEDRLRRLLWDLRNGAEVLNDLDIIKQYLTWPQLLQLDDIGWDFIPYTEQPLRTGLPKFVRKHGTKIRQHSGYTARAELERYRRSGASGHSHRLAAHMASDHNGSHIWFETGCTCAAEAWYGNEPSQNWQQGFIVVTFDMATGAFHPELVYSDRGTAIFRENIYKVS